VRLLKAKEKELKDMDRDLRTVFAYNLNLKANERDVFEFFSKARHPPSLCFCRVARGSHCPWRTADKAAI
jgi:hypothetical protein